MQSKKDLDIHEKKYQKLLNQNSNNFFKPRVKIFQLFEKKINSLKGNILDIGAGTGYASIWLALNSKVDSIISVETSEVCVKKIIPNYSKKFNVENKVKPLNANFINLNFNEHFDYIVSFGSIHHSDCLFETMNTLSKYLKDGGYLIMNEPTMSDYTTNSDYITKYDQEEIIEGIKMKNFERNDKFFRNSEYIVAGCYAGLDLIYQSNFTQENFLKKLKKIFKNLFLLKFLKIINFIKQKKKVNSKIFFFKKKKTNYIPHKWKGLK